MSKTENKTPETNIQDNENKNQMEELLTNFKFMQEQMSLLQKENKELKTKSKNTDDFSLSFDNDYEDGELVTVKFNFDCKYDTRCDRLKKQHDKFISVARMKNYNVLGELSAMEDEFIKFAKKGEVKQIPKWYYEKRKHELLGRYIVDTMKLVKGEPITFYTDDSQQYVEIDEKTGARKVKEGRKLDTGIEEVPLFVVVEKID